MGWITLIEKIGTILVSLIALISFIRSEIRRLRERRKGAGISSKKSGS
jgi:hypothetical protein